MAETLDDAPRYYPFRCSFCPDRKADVRVDGKPLCADCADALLERAQALELCPKLANLLPPLGER